MISSARVLGEPLVVPHPIHSGSPCHVNHYQMGRYPALRRQSHRPPEIVIAPADSDRPALLSQPAFRNLWLASIVSDFGSYVSALALPLTAALTIRATPFQMGLLTALVWLPFVLFGLLAGPVVDRLPRKRLLLSADWIRALAFATIPLAALFGGLGFGLLAVIAVIDGLCTLVFQVAETSLMPAVIDRRDLVAANGRFSASGSATQAVGPGIAGLLTSLLGPPMAIAVDAASYVVSALILRRIPATTRPEAPIESAAVVGRSLRRRARVALADIHAGLHLVFQTPPIRASLLASAVLNLFGYMFLAIYILYMARTLRLSQITIGLILSGGGIGAVVCAVGSDRLRRRFGFGPMMVWSMNICAATTLLIPIAVGWRPSAVALLAAAECIQYGMLAIFNIGGRTLRQVLAPDAFQGRVNATARMVVGTATLVGSLGGGLLGSWIGLGPTLIVGALGMMLAAPIVWFSPLPSMMTLPEPAPPTQLVNTASASG